MRVCMCADLRTNERYGGRRALRRASMYVYVAVQVVVVSIVNYMRGCL